jgi:hypothetical protein
MITRRDHERQQIVQREEAVERGVAGREATQQPGLDRLAHHWNCAEQAGDHLRAPVGHLAPGKHIAHERGRHHEKENNEA